MAGLGFLLFVLGHIFIWFEFNSQFVWPWWQNKAIFSILVIGIPADLLFWYGTKHVVSETGEIWTARMMAFGASYLVFPLLTWVLAHESPFTLKTIICSLMAFAIIFIQIKF